MRALAFAGRFAPRADAGGAWGAKLVSSLELDGRARTAEWGPLQVAVCGPLAREERTGVACVVRGRPRIGALVAELGLPPGTSVATAIASGYGALGARLAERLGGEFALLVWDPERGSGLLARDAVGAEPLFVAESGGALLFASEVRNLLRLLPARPAPDEVAAAAWLARRPLRGGRTLFEGIAAVAPGHTVELERGGWRRRRHWRPAYRRPDPVAPEEAARTLRAEATRAVGAAVADAGRPALMLSGGLDSSSVAAAAAERGARLAAYSTAFPDDPAVDESARVAAVLARLGLPATIVEFRGGSALAAGLDFLSAWELPSVTPNLFVWLPLLRQAAADGADVVLDGEGGDELFGCARYLVADRLRAGRVAGAVRTARRLPGMGERPRRRWIRRALVAYGLRGAVPYAVHERLRRRPPAPVWLAPGAAEAVRAADDPWAWKRRRGPRWWAHLVHALTDAAQGLGAADQLRREGALAGVELRHPLRDPELIEWALGMPPDLAFHPLLDRPLARRAWAGALPSEVVGDDTKPVYNSLPARALSGPDRGPLGRVMADLHPELARMVNPGEVRGLLDRGADSGPAWPLDVWRVASLQLWLMREQDPAALDELRAELGDDPPVRSRRIAASTTVAP